MVVWVVQFQVVKFRSPSTMQLEFFLALDQFSTSLASFIDASLVYGNHNEDAPVLRKLEGGLLKWNRVTGQLPTRIDVGYMEDPDM